MEKTNITRAMLNICPVKRIVATVADAIPKNFLSTEFIIAFVFGELNNANPRPRSMRFATIKLIDVFMSMWENTRRLKVVTTIPADAITLGSILSESQPANGARIVITTG